jgi:hypothetical protein
MANFKAFFPDRVQTPRREHSGCGVVACGVEDLPRGTYMNVEAQNSREAWDKLHRTFPFETIIIEG